ncbi:MAG: alpha/beta hydrolase [Vicinamibacterales bacterium]
MTKRWSRVARLAGAFVLTAFFAAGARAQTPTSELVDAWKAGGAYVEWTSTEPANAGRKVQVFSACLGDASKPAIVMLHGFPTSSIDFRLLIRELQADFRVCTLDFPGYGLSDKPADYRYTLADDARLAWWFVTDVAKLKEFALLSHDRGDSVALAFLQLYQASSTPPFVIRHQFLTNGNMYLPLANLTDFQKRMLDPATSAAAVKAVNAGLLAVGMGQSQYTPPLKADDPEVRALATLFAFKSGVEAIPATIQYLNERKQMEVSYLESLSKSTIPTSVLWGVHDMVSPVRVADYVFTTALKARTVTGAYWLMPCGNHYVQHDQFADIARVIRTTLSSQDSGKALPAVPFNLTSDACSPVLVGRAGR